jgi:hypothetical protein
MQLNSCDQVVQEVWFCLVGDAWCCLVAAARLVPHTNECNDFIKEAGELKKDRGTAT